MSEAAVSTLQACLNGDRPVGAHPALPVTTQQLVNDTVAVVELGVTAVHLHPRNAAGAETLAAAEVATTVAAVRSVARGVEIGVTTGAWIEPDPARRAEFVAGWAGAAAGHPDVASVNVHEPGWRAVCAALADAGVGIELGVSLIHIGRGRPAGRRAVVGGRGAGAAARAGRWRVAGAGDGGRARPAHAHRPGRRAAHPGRQPGRGQPRPGQGRDHPRQSDDPLTGCCLSTDRPQLPDGRLADHRPESPASLTAGWLPAG